MATGIVMKALRILHVHNFYRSSAPSGENAAVLQERETLRRRGHDVIEHNWHSDFLEKLGPIGTFLGGVSTPFNPLAAIALVAAIYRYKVDIVHFHNTFPMISGAPVLVARLFAAVVITLHNFRTICLAGIPMRHGIDCFDCFDARSPTPGIRNKCYRNSVVASLPIAAAIQVNRRLGTWQSVPDAVIALTEYHRNLFVRNGFDESKVVVRANSVDVPIRELVRGRKSRNYAVYVGRLTVEKGVATLVAAWRSLGASAPELLIVGDGNLRAELVGRADGARVSFLGAKTKSEVLEIVSEAALVIIPSECIEGLPMVLVESYAVATPVLMSDRGALAQYAASDDFVFRSGDSVDLANKVEKLFASVGALVGAKKWCLAYFSEHFSEEVTYRQLREVYGLAMKNYSGRRRRSRHRDRSGL